MASILGRRKPLAPRPGDDLDDDRNSNADAIRPSTRTTYQQQQQLNSHHIQSPLFHALPTRASKRKSRAVYSRFNRKKAKFKLMKPEVPAPRLEAFKRVLFLRMRKQREKDKNNASAMDGAGAVSPEEERKKRAAEREAKRQKQLDDLKKKLETLRDDKHKLFSQLKTVLLEEQKQKQLDKAAEKKLQEQRQKNEDDRMEREFLRREMILKRGVPSSPLLPSGLASNPMSSPHVAARSGLLSSPMTPHMQSPLAAPAGASGWSTTVVQPIDVPNAQPSPYSSQQRRPGTSPAQLQLPSQGAPSPMLISQPRVLSRDGFGRDKPAISASSQRNRGYGSSRVSYMSSGTNTNKRSSMDRDDNRRTSSFSSMPPRGFSNTPGTPGTPSHGTSPGLADSSGGGRGLLGRGPGLLPMPNMSPRMYSARREDERRGQRR